MPLTSWRWAPPLTLRQARPTTATGHKIKNLDEVEKEKKLAEYSKYIWTKARGGREGDDVYVANGARMDAAHRVAWPWSVAMCVADVWACVADAGAKLTWVPPHSPFTHIHGAEC